MESNIGCGRGRSRGQHQNFLLEFARFTQVVLPTSGGGATHFPTDAANQHKVVRCYVTQLPRPPPWPGLIHSFITIHIGFSRSLWHIQWPLHRVNDLSPQFGGWKHGLEILCEKSVWLAHQRWTFTEMSMTLLIASPPRSEKFHLFCTCSCKNYLRFST